MKKKDAKILIADDLKDMRMVLSTLLKREGYNTITADNGSTAVELARKELPDAVIMDIKMPVMDGIEALKQIKKFSQTIPVILMTAYGEVETAVEAVKLGAYDYIVKPFDNEKIIITFKNALAELRLKREVKTLRSNLEGKSPISEIMGTSNELKRVFLQVERVAPTNFTVVLYGETGSGKELVARAIHNQSPRRKGEFVAVDCGAIPETLIESELFGYEKGAFTGADKRKEGVFELASRGSLFLDEIGNLPKSMQSKLLRVIEDHCVRRLGGKENIKIDIRIILACNEKLEDLVKAGKFREDLYHRLNEFTIEIPPLRKRKEDIISLSRKFVDITNQELDKNVRGFSESALKCLFNYNWPGNIRELKNVVRKAVLMADDIIEPENIPIKKSRLKTDPIDRLISQPFKIKKIDDKDFSLKDIVKKVISDVEKQVISEVLKRTKGNKSKASRILKIDYKTMHCKVKDYRIRVDNDGSFAI